MRIKLSVAAFLVWFPALGALLLTQYTATASTPRMKVEIILVWATNDSQSPHKPVQPDVKKKLKELPLRWANYFEVNRKVQEITLNNPKKEPLSEKCSVEVKVLDATTVEVGLFGHGTQVVRRIQQLPKGEILVFGGNAPNSTGWLVVLKRLE